MTSEELLVSLPGLEPPPDGVVVTEGGTERFVVLSFERHRQLCALEWLMSDPERLRGLLELPAKLEVEVGRITAAIAAGKDTGPTFTFLEDLPRKKKNSS